jgi:hypothetical protein
MHENKGCRRTGPWIDAWKQRMSSDIAYQIMKNDRVIREWLCISKDEITSDAEVRSCDETVGNVWHRRTGCHGHTVLANHPQVSGRNHGEVDKIPQSWMRRTVWMMSLLFFFPPLWSNVGERHHTLDGSRRYPCGYGPVTTWTTIICCL